MAKLVLVIDDDLDVWTTLALRLKSFGYLMISAKDGTQGYVKIKELKPDLILLDLGFGKGQEDGLEILKRLKTDASDQIQNIPVIMLTGKEGLEQQCLDAGACGYITKPFDLFQLKEILSKHLSK